jgi:ABC-type glycerol-3-phosphate transport system substrate-binding protein
MQNKKLFIIGGIVLFIIIVVVLSVVFGGSDKKTPPRQVSLEIWGTFENSENMQPFITAYQQLNPNVQITYTEKNIETYEDDLLNALASGTGPDIYSIHNDWLPKYQDKLIEANPEIMSLKYYNDSFLDAPNQDFVKDNKIYAAALSVDSLALYYNEDILGREGIAEPPRTWLELRQQVKAITEPSLRGGFIKSGVAMGTASNINRAVDIAYLLMFQNGVVPYTSDYTQATLDAQQQTGAGNVIYPAADALVYYTSFSNPVSDVYTWNANSNYSLDAFANNELAFIYGYSYTRDYITQKNPSLNFSVTVVPQPNLAQNPVYFANYWGFGVSKQTKEADYAWDFIRSITTKEQLTEYYKRHTLPTSRRDMVSDQINDDKDPHIGIFAHSNVNAKTMYKKDARAVDNAITNMINSVVNKGIGPQQAVSDANQQINLLSNFR